MGKYIISLFLTLLILFTVVCADKNTIGTNTIGPEGGEVVSRDGFHTLIFKPGALSQEVEVELIKLTFTNELFITEGPQTCAYTYNKNDIAPFLNMNPMVEHNFGVQTKDENGNSNVKIEPLIQRDDGNGNPRLMEDNTTIVDTNEDTVIQSATLFTDQGEVLIPPKDIELIGFFSVNKFKDPDGFPMLDIIFTPSNLGFFIDDIFLRFLNGLQQNTPLEMDSESGNLGIILPNLCDPLSANPSTTDAMFELDINDQIFFNTTDSLSLEYKTNCEEHDPDTPPLPPPLTPPPGLSVENILGAYGLNCFCRQDTLLICTGNFGGGGFTTGININRNTDNRGLTITKGQEITDIIITTPEDLFTLEGQLTDLEDGTFGAEAEGSGFLGDTSSAAADIIVKAEGWIFDLDEQGNVVLAEGDLRFNFPGFLSDSVSSVAECTGVKIE